MANHYDDEDRLAYARLLQSLSALQYIAIKYYRLGSSEQMYPCKVSPPCVTVGAGPKDQTNRARVLRQIVSEANGRIANLLPSNAALQVDSCPSGYYLCNGDCIHRSLPCL
jgi:hypothetical protein